MDGRIGWQAMACHPIDPPAIQCTTPLHLEQQYLQASWKGGSPCTTITGHHAPSSKRGCVRCLGILQSSLLPLASWPLASWFLASWPLQCLASCQLASCQLVWPQASWPLASWFAHQPPNSPLPANISFLRHSSEVAPPTFLIEVGGVECFLKVGRTTSRLSFRLLAYASWQGGLC